MLLRALYTILYVVGFVVLGPYYLLKMARRGKYRENFFQRFGFYNETLRQRLIEKTETRCWIQAVSVGEVNIALLLIPELRKQFESLRVILTTTTTTAHALARQQLPKDVELMYFPQDFSFSVRRAFDLIQPDFIILIESEIWPKHVWTAGQRGVPIFLLNARMSPRSAARYRRLRFLSPMILRQLTLVCAQSADNAENFACAGMPTPRILMTGNMKYDACISSGSPRSFDPSQILTSLGVASSHPVLVAGSTHPGEEAILFEVYARLRQTHPELFLVLVPRHVERTEEILELAKEHRVNLVLRSQVDTMAARAERPDCLLVNTTGELRGFYEVATVIFVGKSLVGRGGQNIIEAAASGHPVLFGPHMGNFREITAQVIASGAGIQVVDAAALHQELEGLLNDPNRQQAIANAARELIRLNAGATQRSVAAIAAALDNN